MGQLSTELVATRARECAATCTHRKSHDEKERKTANSTFSHNTTNTCHAPFSAPELHAILSTGCQGQVASAARYHEVDMCHDMSHHVPKSAQNTLFALSGAMDITNAHHACHSTLKVAQVCSWGARAKVLRNLPPLHVCV